MTVNVALHLARMAQSMPHRPAVIYPEARDASGRVAYTHLTFAQLHKQSDQMAAGLSRFGIRRGMRTVLMVTPSLHFFTLTFALFKLGAVPILIDPGMGIRNLGRCLGEAEPEAFIGVPKAQIARRLLGWGRKTIRRTITVGRQRWGGDATLDQVTRRRPVGCFSPADTQADEVAAILFTSGSTGIAKGVVYTHGIFATQVEYLRTLYGIEPGEVDLPTFPLFALFSPALGMTAVIPDMDPTRPAKIDPRKAIEAIENFGITNLFGSPAVINRLGRYGSEHGVALPTLRRVISAGAPVSATIIERFCGMLSPGVELHTPYGATEALPVASIGSDTILGETRHATDRGYGVCIGHPVPGVEVHIIPIHDEEIPTWDAKLSLPAGQLGEITVRGAVVTHRYYGRERATRLAKIYDEGGTVYHRMGDVGYRDEQGRLWFCGRKSHRVITSQGTLYTIPCEAVFTRLPQVFRAALVGVLLAGQVYPVMCIELEPGQSISEAELRQVAQQQPHTQAITRFLFHPKFPVDIRHNAKIFREKLAVWATKQLRGWQPTPLPPIVPGPIAGSPS